MNKFRGRVADRIIAVILAIVMVIGALPITVFAGEGDYPDQYLIFVQDKDNQGIPEADIDYTIKVDGDERESDSTQTDAEGYAGIDMFDYQSEFDDGSEITLSYVISKEGYIEASEDDVPITDLKGSLPEITLEADEPEMAQITVQATAEGTVKINDSEVTNQISVVKGEPVKVEITPNENAYISSLSIGGSEISTIEKFDSYTDDALTVDDDIDIIVEFVSVVTVTAISEEGGSIKLNGEDTETVTVDKGSEVALEVTPEEGYQIVSVSVDGAPQDIVDIHSYTSRITADKDITVSARFAKEYTVTVSFTGDGTVATEPENEGGSVTVKTGTTVKLTATPNENYRISQIVTNGVADIINDYRYSNSNPYTDEFVVEKEYTIEITFSLAVFDVEFNENPNGDVTVANSRVNYNESTTVNIKAHDGYNVKSISVNDNQIEFEEDKIKQIDNKTIQFEISNITEKQVIEVSYEKIPKIDMPDAVAAFKNNAVRVDEEGGLYVYAKDASVTISTDEGGISLDEITEDGQDFNTASVDIMNTTKIENIYLYYDYAWHSVGLGDNGIKLVIDKELELKEKNQVFSPDVDREIYNSDFYVNVEVEDNGDDYSGIASVVYYITNSNGDVTQGKGSDDPDNGVLYQYDAQNDPEKNKMQQSWSGSIRVDSELNNDPKVVINLEVTDLAGNTASITSRTFIINSTPPEITVNMIDVDETPHDEAEPGYYNNVRKATIIVKDRSDTINEDEIFNGIDISVAENDEKAAAANFNLVSDEEKEKMIEISGEGDEREVTITFEDDAYYKWNISYINDAGLPNKQIETDDEYAFKFTVDTKPPIANIVLDNNTWTDIVEKLTFGIWKKSPVEIKVTDVKDEITSVKGENVKVLYYADDGKILSESSSKQEVYDELEAVFADNQFKSDPYVSQNDEKFVVFARLTDLAGNTSYISTNGIVYDKTFSDDMIELNLLTEPNENNIFTSDVEIGISVKDFLQEDAISSGISKIDYEIVSTVQTTEGTLYDFRENENYKNPSYDDLKKSWNTEDDHKPLVVSAEEHNSNNVVVTVKVTDNAGNKYQQSIGPFNINISKPDAEIKINGTKDANAYAKDHFKKVSAQVVVTDRSDSFDDKAAHDGILINAVDSKDNKLTLAEGKDYKISEWKHSLVNGLDTYTAVVDFISDGNYTIGFNYLNKTLVEKNRINLEEKTFTKDSTQPTGSIFINDNIWDTILETLSFGLYSNTKVEITASADDATSKSYPKIEYLKTDGSTVLSEDDLASKAKEFSVNKPEIKSNEQFVIYLKITDAAGNITYISSDGYISDNTKSNITFTPNQSEITQSGPYNGNVDVKIEVDDAEPYSGIQKIEYWVECDGKETQRQTLYNFDYQREQTKDGKNTNGGTLTITDWSTGKEVIKKVKGVPSQKQLRSHWEGTVTVEAGKNNSSNVVLYVQTVDNAGNTAKRSIALDIDTTAPTIAISYNNNNDNNGNTYFDATRTATVVITERTNHFDADKATEGIMITAKDAKNADVANAYTISKWVTVEGATPDEATHTATINFSADANYNFSITYTDKANNANKKVTVEKGTAAPYKFTVDTTAPTGTVTASSAEGRETTWSRLLSALTFGFWSRKNIVVTATYDDVTSAPIASVEYYKVVSANANDNTTALSKSALDAITEWQPFKKLTVNANEQFIVYLKITDLAGNYTYLSTDGLIVDDKAPEELIAPEITVNPEQPVNGFYNGDVKVDIKVSDPLIGGTYSGLKTITYQVLNMGEVTQSGTLYSFDVKNPTQKDLLQTWTGSITVDSALNNSNDVVIEIFAEDNSLNTSRESASIKIDITAPTIEVSYSNNDADSSSYFKANRTATIVITERNFDPSDVITKITNTDGIVPKLSGWTKTNGTGNGDDTRWTATVTYSADGDYKFSIEYTDLANNHNSRVQYGDSVAPTSFTIDKTMPVIDVVYDNNSAENTNYYKDERTATITITEHNFNSARVVPTITATDDGEPTTIPTISGWSTNGDVHTATIHYAGDAIYSFDIDCTDMAGNASADFAQQTFYVDKTNPTLEITGVANNSANSGAVIPVVSYSDTNYDPSRVTITLSGANHGIIDSFDGTYADIHNGRTFTFADFAREKDVDDIYTLTASLTDMAGNTTEESIVFSVNRFGSNYTISDDTESLNGTYVKSPRDVVITETNADELADITITLFKNDKTITLVEGTDYRVSISGGNGSWYQYTYTIFAKNFADDGLYSIRISSVDAAGNSAANDLDVKGMEISFGVDKNAPTLIVTNLESGRPYVVESLTVIMKANDDYLLNSVVVYLDDYNVAYKTWNAEQIAEILAQNGDFTFDIAGDSASAHNVRIVCTDAAGNELVEEITNFRVSTTFGARLLSVLYDIYNTKPLFYGLIAGVILIAALIIFLVVWKRRKKEENK